MAHPYSRYENTPLWKVIETALDELRENGDVQLGTAKEYVVGLMCQRMDGRGVVPASALRHRTEHGLGCSGTTG